MLGLALGSGGAKGLAHIGVIKVLEQEGVKIDLIAGSSIGALIGCWYAATKDIKKIEQNIILKSWKQILELILDPSVSGGLINGSKIQSFMQKYIGGKTFDDLLIPCNVVATDLHTGQKVVIDSGDISEAIRASISVPLIFRPVKRDAYLLTDGGISEPVPVETLRNMGATTIIAVNLDVNYFEKNKYNHETSFYSIAQNSLHILRYHLAAQNVKDADITIEPQVKQAGPVGWRHFLNGQKNILAGESAMRAALTQVKSLLKNTP